MILTFTKIMLDDIQEELEDLERYCIEMEDMVDANRESLDEIDLEMDSMDTANPDIEGYDETRYQELVREKEFLSSSTEEYEAKLDEANKKLNKLRETLLHHQQSIINKAKIPNESQIPSKTSYTKTEFEITPDVIADQRLGTIEKTFRKLIVKVLDLSEPWTKDKIPSDIIRKVTDQRQKNNVLDDVEVPLINELDFTHYKEIFIYNANWQLFKDVFVDKQGLETKLTELAPIRNIIAHHKRAITETESKRVTAPLA